MRKGASLDPSDSNSCLEKPRAVDLNFTLRNTTILRVLDAKVGASETYGRLIRFIPVKSVVFRPDGSETRPELF